MYPIEGSNVTIYLSKFALVPFEELIKNRWIVFWLTGTYNEEVFEAWLSSFSNVKAWVPVYKWTDLHKERSRQESVGIITLTFENVSDFTSTECPSFLRVLTEDFTIPKVYGRELVPCYLEFFRNLSKLLKAETLPDVVSIGDTVKIMSGPFKHFAGKVVSIKKTGVVVELELFGRTVTVDILDPSILTKIED